MPPLPRRPQALFVLFALGFAALLGAAWLQQGPSAGELFLPLAKTADFEQACRSVHGIAWWTPSYLGGHSLAPIWSTILTTAPLELGRLLFGPLAGYKIVALLALVAAGWAMFRFVLDLTGAVETAVLAGAFYLLCPEFAIRLAGAEHLGTVFCFPWAPVICHRLWRLRRDGTRRDEIVLALAVAALLLTSTKVGLLFLPAALGFALWLYYAEADGRAAFALRLGRAALLAAPPALLPLLPLLREEAWMNLFAHDPLLQWQQSFSVKTAFSWWDRNGAILSAGSPVAAPGEAFYLGFVWTLAIGIVAAGGLGLRGWFASREGSLCRCFLVLALAFHWLSYGPYSVAAAFRLALDAGMALPNWSIPLLWLALTLQLALVGALAAGWVQKHKGWTAALAIVVYLFLPVFHIFEKIPFYSELRAPASLWNVNGSFCAALAAALAARAIVDRLAARAPGGFRLRGLAVAGIVALTALDFSGYEADFGRGALPGETYADFLAAADFLRHDPTDGAVFPVSGRYFYLQLPQLAGRPLTTEAATSYFQMRWTRALMEEERQSEASFGWVLAASGAAFILVDKTDPQLPPAYAASLRQHYAAVYENAHFAVLQVPNTIAPALAVGRVQLQPDGTAPGTMLGAIANDVWTLTPGPAGMRMPAHQDAPSGRVPLLQPRLSDYQTIRVAAAPPGRPWIIVPESYHPDWTAEADGKPVPIDRALGCYLAASSPREGAAITFRFRPPWWYPVSLGAGALCWLLLIAAALRSPRP